jgi:MoaA/NifB/PqqE/SkfB family radical SAM enzyme
VEPFINLSHSTEGNYQLCCVAITPQTAEYSTDSHTPLEFMNSDYMTSVREDMLSHALSEQTASACASCIKNEAVGMQSRRLTQNAKYQNAQTLDTIRRFVDNPDEKLLASDLQYVNLKMLGNICNLKCIMCNPNSSSKIAAEFKKHKIKDIDKTIKTAYNDDSKAGYFADIAIILENIDRFSLIGGEAFVHPDFDEIFEMVMNSSNVGNIDLFIITNGTLLPQKVLDNAHRFGRLTLNFSIDGVGDRASYIRNGTVWSVYDNNLRRAIASDAHVSFTVAVQTLNIGYLDEIYDYVVSVGIDPAFVGWSTTVTYPARHNASNIPTGLKQEYKDKYAKRQFKHIESLAQAMSILDTQHDSDNEFQEFIRQQKFFDNIRNECLTDVFPEFSKYI